MSQYDMISHIAILFGHKFPNEKALVKGVQICTAVMHGIAVQQPPNYVLLNPLDPESSQLLKVKIMATIMLARVVLTLGVGADAT